MQGFSEELVRHLQMRVHDGDQAVFHNTTFKDADFQGKMTWILYSVRQEQHRPLRSISMGYKVVAHCPPYCSYQLSKSSRCAPRAYLSTIYLHWTFEIEQSIRSMQSFKAVDLMEDSNGDHSVLEQFHVIVDSSTPSWSHHGRAGAYAKTGKVPRS